jgi:SAM-dependent methyltransferase
MPEFLNSNRALWNAWTELHEQSEFYNVAGFRAGGLSLRSIEREEIGGDVAGRSLLHLMCHFGLDTLSWARLGARVTGVDLSDKAIALARALSQEQNLPADFVCADVLGLPAVLTGQFDIVYTSYGILHWIADLPRWAQVIGHFLKPGGYFYIVEDHPFMRVFSADQAAGLVVDNPYWFEAEPYRFEAQGSYAQAVPAGSVPTQVGYMWDHSLSELFNSLLGAGLKLDFFNEHRVAARAKFPFMQPRGDGWYELPDRYRNSVPMLFSLKATKTAL